MIPIAQHKEGVLDKAFAIRDELLKSGFKVKVDDSDKSPGWKFSEQEMKGIPVRIEIGPKDIEANQAVIVRRDTREKIVADSDKSPGWKFSEQEMKGIPVRIEIGPKDIEANQAVIVRRDTREKIVASLEDLSAKLSEVLETMQKEMLERARAHREAHTYDAHNYEEFVEIVSLEDLSAKLSEVLETMQKEMLERARAHREAHTYDAHNYEEFVEIVNEKPGFVRGMWCGDQACEDKIKEDTTATSRCMPFHQEKISDVCVCCGKPAKSLVYWGKAY